MGDIVRIAKNSKMKSMIRELNNYRDSYYNKSESLISDYEYDELFDRLKNLEEETGIIFSGSPTQTVGYEVKSNLQKVVHNHPMLSLDKTKSISDLKSFLNNQTGIMMPKLDGLTISLKYLNGKLVSAETRGNGEIGEDILHNAKMFENIPLQIDFQDGLIVDGEAIITYENFERINEALDKKDKYKNPRNLASGSVRQLDSAITKGRNIRFVAWKLVNGCDDNEFTDRLRILNTLGFEVVPYSTIIKGSDLELENEIEYLKEMVERLSYPIDGMVIGYNDVAYGESLGMTGHHLRSQIAYKFYDEEVETIIKDIEWTMGKTGVLTPTAVFEPVEIDGTTVERASVHNVSILEELELCAGDTVTVYKANQIIPQIKENISARSRQDQSYINQVVPATCPVCEHETIIKKVNSTKVLICSNHNCKGKLLGRFSHFVSKNAMNVDGLSEATISKLIDKGWLGSFIDIYTLMDNHYNEIVSMDGFGKRSADKLRTAIEDSKDTTLERFIYALCIPLIGRTASKTISKFFDGDFEKFFNEGLLGRFDWSRLDDFGDTMATSINEFTQRADVSTIYELATLMNFQKPQSINSSVDLTGKTFVITGSLNKFSNRDEAKEKIESLGGKVAGSVSKKTSFLVNNDSTSTSGKNKKAKELGVMIITEEGLLEMIS